VASQGRDLAPGQWTGQASTSYSTCKARAESAGVRYFAWTPNVYNGYCKVLKPTVASPNLSTNQGYGYKLYHYDLSTGSEDCYNGAKYQTAACAECTGPGPTQCIRCNDDAALVPFRATNHTSRDFALAGFEGACAKYTNQTQVLDLPGLATAAASLLATISSKWVEVIHSGIFPGATATGIATVELSVNCAMHKVVWCAARTDASQGQTCNVHKSARVKSVRTMNLGVTAGTQSACTSCSNAGGHAWNGCISCGKQESGVDGKVTHAAPPVPKLLDLVNLPTPHDACRAAAQLL